MSLPKQLIKSYNEINNCDLVVRGKVTEENIRFFVNELNKAIPSKDNVLAFTIYKFNRNKYLSDKDRFIRDIIEFKYYENMILWTDYDDILEYFKLRDKIFLGWDRYTNKYKAYTPRNNACKLSSDGESPRDSLASEDSEKKITIKSKIEEGIEAIDKHMDDSDRLADYMAEKRKKLEESLNQSA